MDFEKNYYAILGVSRKASTPELKIAYRKLAKLYHPDLHPNDPGCEEKLKAINEAWGVLGNDDQKFVYDRFFENQEVPKIAPKERRHTTKKWVTTEEKVFVQGELRLKYRGSQDDALSNDVLKEVFYRLKFTEAEAFIPQAAISKGEMPADFAAAYASEPLRLDIPQPVNCVISSATGARYYQLALSDLILTDPKIQDVTKDDGDSFGTLVAHFYAHILYLRYEEVESTTAEAYGETGRHEYQTTDQVRYRRYEYYAANGSPYWGNWVRVTPFDPVRKPGPAIQSEGCMGILVNLIRMLFLLLIGLKIVTTLPFLWPVALIALGCWLVSGRALGIFFSAIAFLFSALFLFAFIYTLTHTRASSLPAVPHDRPAAQKITHRAAPGNDSLLIRYREWRDYEGNRYAGSYWVSARAWQKDHLYKQNFEASAGSADELYQRAVAGMADRDEMQLNGLYHLLDSIQQKRHLRADKFAEMFVSFIQDIPYALVLSKACEANLYGDPSIGKYLARADARCEPEQRFGLNTPLEFLATTYGDCDTRTLLAFTVLRHYGYSVALLSSQTYSHSLLGIELPYGRATYTAGGHYYTPWETTAPAPPGILADEISNLDYWTITLTAQP